MAAPQDLVFFPLQLKVSEIPFILCPEGVVRNRWDVKMVYNQESYCPNKFILFYQWDSHFKNVFIIIYCVSWTNDQIMLAFSAKFTFTFFLLTIVLFWMLSLETFTIMAELHVFLFLTFLLLLCACFLWFDVLQCPNLSPITYNINTTGRVRVLWLNFFLFLSKPNANFSLIIWALFFLVSSMNLRVIQCLFQYLT